MIKYTVMAFFTESRAKSRVFGNRLEASIYFETLKKFEICEGAILMRLTDKVAIVDEFTKTKDWAELLSA